jgi:hypothetical protein
MAVLTRQQVPEKTNPAVDRSKDLRTFFRAPPALMTAM